MESSYEPRLAVLVVHLLVLLDATVVVVGGGHRRPCLYATPEEEEEQQQQQQFIDYQVQESSKMNRWEEKDRGFLEMQ